MCMAFRNCPLVPLSGSHAPSSSVFLQRHPSFGIDSRQERREGGEEKKKKKRKRKTKTCHTTCVPRRCRATKLSPPPKLRSWLQLQLLDAQKPPTFDSDTASAEPKCASHVSYCARSCEKKAKTRIPNTNPSEFSKGKRHLKQPLTPAWRTLAIGVPCARRSWPMSNLGGNGLRTPCSGAIQLHRLLAIASPGAVVFPRLRTVALRHRSVTSGPAVRLLAG